MPNVDRQPSSPQAPAPDGPPKVREFPRPVEPEPEPSLSRGRKIVLASLVTLALLTLTAAGVSAAANPAHGGGDFQECATQCPM